MSPVCVRLRSLGNRARPKSVIQTAPWRSIRRLAGLMSRWRIPRPWAWSSASAASAPKRATLRQKPRSWCIGPIADGVEGRLLAGRADADSEPRRPGGRLSRSRREPRCGSVSAGEVGRRARIRSTLPRELFGRDRSPGASACPPSRPGRTGRAKLVEDGGQAAAVDELHGVVVDAVVAADAEDRHDVRMVQLGGGLGLDLEPLALLGVDRRGEGQDLERDAPAQRDLLGLVDDAHAAAADLAEDPVFAELGACGNRIGETGRGDLRIGKLGGGGLDELEPGKALAKCLGDLGMPGQEFVARTGMPGPKCLEVRLKRSDHARVVLGKAAERQRRGDRFAAGRDG